MTDGWDWLAEPREVIESCSPWMNPRPRVRRHLRQLARLTNLESLCHRCGDCCRLSLKLPHPAGGDVRVLVPELPCRYLVQDGDVVACAVYGKRAELAPWCEGTEDGMTAGLYTERCGYVEGADWYSGSVRVPDDFLRHLLPEVRACPAGPIKASVLRRFCERWGP